LLFTCSWHQNPESFFLRGGLDVLRAFEIVHERYPHVRLTLRTRLPGLKKRYQRILERGWVRVIDRYLSENEMHKLMSSTHLFLLPAARIHVVSVLRAMAYGQVVVASDGWGFREYVEHGTNGVIVPGRYGIASWMDDGGMLREDYNPMFRPHASVTNGLVEAISALVEDNDLRWQLGRQARWDVANRFNFANWNQGLKRAFDVATRSAA
jgi:glycosyltransferase involved in cell wall biosynthesis